MVISLGFSNWQKKCKVDFSFFAFLSFITFLDGYLVSLCYRLMLPQNKALGSHAGGVIVSKSPRTSDPR